MSIITFITSKRTLNEYLKKVRTVSNLPELKMLVTKESTPTLKSIVKSLNTSVAAMNKIINQNLQLKKKSNNVH